MIQSLAFLWWDFCPSINIRLWRRIAREPYPAFFVHAYRWTVFNQMTLRERQYILIRKPSP